MPNQHITCPSLGQWAKIGLLFCITLIGVVTLATPSGRQGLSDSITWAKAHQTSAFVFYVLTFAVGAVIHLPEVLLAIASGYIFNNVFVMVLATDLGATLGALFAWFVGRVLLRETFVNFVVHKFPSFAALDAMSGTPNAWKILLLIRIPFVPYIAVNFALSVTQVKCWTYTWTTALGLLPGSLVYGLIGRGVGELADLHESASRKDPVVLALSIAGVIMCIFVFFVVRWYVKKELDRGTLNLRGHQDMLAHPIMTSRSPSARSPEDEDETEEEADLKLTLPPVRMGPGETREMDTSDDVALRIPGPSEDTDASGSPTSAATSSLSPVAPSKRSPKKSPLIPGAS